MKPIRPLLIELIVIVVMPVDPAALERTFVLDTLPYSVSLDGDISLRDAITASNTNRHRKIASAVIRDRISFNLINPIGNGTIVLEGQIRITEELDIDGTTNCPMPVSSQERSL